MVNYGVNHGAFHQMVVLILGANGLKKMKEILLTNMEKSKKL